MQPLQGILENSEPFASNMQLCTCCMVWYRASFASRSHRFLPYLTVVADWLLGKFSWLSNDHQTTSHIATTLWAIWKQRNATIFRKQVPSPSRAMRHSSTFNAQIVQAYSAKASEVTIFC